MLQFGGGFPAEWGDPDVVSLDCMDKTNLVTIELRMVREWTPEDPAHSPLAAM